MFEKFLAVFFFITLSRCVVGQGKCPDTPGGPATHVCDLILACDGPSDTPSAGLLLPVATQCSNQLPDADCQQLFPCLATGGVTACDHVEDSTPGPPYVRAPACTNPNLQSVALQCANQCAMCCLLPQYNCNDDINSPINCTLNMNKCKDSQWTNVMAQYCPSTCGLCTSGTCRDTISGCNTMVPLCKDVDWQTFMRANCSRTCSFCTGSNSTSSSSSTCVDIASNCAPNANLCTNSIYRPLMLQDCCATCNRTSISSLCSDAISNCAQYAYLCTNSIYRSLMLRQCCATCSGTSSSSSFVVSSSCADSSTSCSIWLRNGFCSSVFYTTAQKRQYCARTCNLC